jgi:hypothetical protein
VTPYITFAGLPMIGVDFTTSRGTRPGVARIKVPHDQPIEAIRGLLVFGAEGAISLNVTPDLSTIRYENTAGGRRSYVMLAHDGRQEWANKPADGDFNRRYRDSTIEDGTEKTLQELCQHLVDGASVTDAYTTVRPRAGWQEATVAGAMDGLRESLPIHVCWRPGDTFSIQRTGEGATIDSSAVPIKIPDYIATIERGPKTLIVQCGPTWFQMRLELEAVGLDTDGEWKLIDALSYKPADGWEGQWPEAFSEVAEASRPLALRTVFRCYRVKVQSVDGHDGTISDASQFLLDPWKVEMAGSGPKYLQPAEVYGTFWPWSDVWDNITNGMYPGDFTIHPDLSIVWFELPVIQVKESGCFGAAELELETGFHVYDDDGSLARRKFTWQRTHGHGEKAWQHPELWECIVDGASTNSAQLTAEANEYLSAWMTHYNTIRDIRDVPASGVWPVGCSGNIAQVSFRAGRGLSPETRMSEHYEHR